jgi:hypothetical protein
VRHQERPVAYADSERVKGKSPSGLAGNRQLPARGHRRYPAPVVDSKKTQITITGAGG